MVVIGEEYLLMNLLMDTLCLTAAMRLSSLRARPGRVLLSALAGALLSMIALSLWGLHASAYAALPIAVLMALLAFGLRRAPGGSAKTSHPGDERYRADPECDRPRAAMTRKVG